jgi:hypothetical protein
MIAAWLLLSTVMLQSSPAMRVLEGGAQSFIDSPRTVVARTQSEWEALWKVHAPSRDIPKVDFEREMVVAVFGGSRNTAGYSVQVVGTEEQGSVLVVRYRETTPRPAAILAQVVTFPHQIVAIPKYGGTVRFEKLP